MAQPGARQQVVCQVQSSLETLHLRWEVDKDIALARRLIDSANLVYPQRSSETSDHKLSESSRVCQGQPTKAQGIYKKVISSIIREFLKKLQIRIAISVSRRRDSHCFQPSGIGAELLPGGYESYGQVCSNFNSLLIWVSGLKWDCTRTVLNSLVVLAEHVLLLIDVTKEEPE